MVINTRYELIFVHVPKAAGTSIARCLKAKWGNNRRWLGSTKHETLGELHAQIQRRRTLKHRLLSETPVGYFVFGFVRNPWDRMLSCYRYLVEHGPRKEIETVNSFKEFLIQARDGCPWINGLHSMRPQLDFFTCLDGMMRADFLGHFEHLEEDIESVSEATGCPIRLRHHNRSSNALRDYRLDYDDAMVELVAERFAEEIALFGYTFDRPQPGKRCSATLHRCRRELSFSRPAHVLCAR